MITRAPDMIARITRAYSRLYTDTGQRKVYVEWVDQRGQCGRTEDHVPAGLHMHALLERAVREGLPIEREVW